MHDPFSIPTHSCRTQANKMVSCLKKYFSKKQNDLELRSVFKPLYIVLSILGLFPYSVQLRNGNKGFIIIPKSIYLNGLCALAIMSAIVSFLVIHIRHIYFSIEKSALTEGIMTEVNYVTELLTLQIFCLVTYTSVFCNRRIYVKILSKLSVLIDTKVNSDKILQRIRFLINVRVLGSLSILLIMQVVVNFTRSDSTFKMFLVVFSFNLPQMIQFTVLAFFYVLIVMVVEIFRRLRNHIVFAPVKTTDGFTEVGSIVHFTLRQTEVIYIEAFEIVQRVNRMFEAPILVTMVQCFHSTVSEAHIIYHGVVVQRNLMSHEIVNCSIWILYQLAKIYVVSSAGNLLRLEVLKLSRAIYTIPTEKQDLRFFAEVQHLSALMSLPEKELTVYGYFPLDNTLMFKVIAAAAMYIIILVQFDKKN